jgi:hypothetical protein
VLADADLLVADTDDAVAGHAPGDPLLAGGVRTWSRCPWTGAAHAEPAGRGGVAESLVGPFVVVVGDPLVQRRLGDLEAGEDPASSLLAPAGSGSPARSLQETGRLSRQEVAGIEQVLGQLGYAVDVWIRYSTLP